MKTFPALLTAALLGLPVAVGAHEFWIEPLDYTVPAGTEVKADLRVGEFFAGTPYSFVPTTYVRFDSVMADQTEPVTGRAGDRPAYAHTPQDAGLLVIAHVTRPQRLTYKEMAKFEKFARHKDFLWAVEAHADRGLPDSDFTEGYVRFAKSLVAVGDGAGEDRALGLETEIIALENPYTGDLTDGFSVQVMYQGAPRGDAQVELFEKAPDGTVEITLHRTDEGGQVTLPVKSGHSYLADAVVLRAVDPDADSPRSPVWESLWASLTFAAP